MQLRPVHSAATRPCRTSPERARHRLEAALGSARPDSDKLRWLWSGARQGKAGSRLDGRSWSGWGYSATGAWRPGITPDVAHSASMGPGT